MIRNNRLSEAKRWTSIGLVLILAVAAGLRLQHIRSDPPRILPSISGSAGIYFDEGIYCHNARNRILFGRWITDEWNPMVYSAPLTLVYFLAFKLFGISMVTVKSVNILFGLAGILLFFGGLRRYMRSRTALILAALFAFDYYGMMYNRIGLLENFCVLGFMLGFYLFSDEKNRRGTAFSLGLVVAVTSLSKYLFAYFLISTLLAVAYRAFRRRDARYLAYFLSGVFAVGMLWFGAIYLPFRATFSKIGSGWGMLSLPRSIAQAWSNLVHNPLPRYLQLAPLAGFFLVLFVGLVLWKTIRRRSTELDPLDVFVFLWIAGAVLSMGFLNYRPLRYYLPLIPAIYLGISLLVRDKERIRTSGLSFWFLTLVAAGLFWPFFAMLFRKPSAFFVFPAGFRVLILLSFVGAIAFFVLGGGRWRTGLATALVSLMLSISGFLYVKHFYLEPTYDLDTASQYMSTLGPDSVVMGQEAPRLTLGTPYKALLAYENWFNDKDLFVRFKPSHLIVLNKFGGAEFGWIKRRYPEVAGRLEPVREFKVWDTTMTLYRVLE
jgi:4-amino-4-deoxy-L-arabinose transferase-like glycosyltransferase